jgi:hypothetical protein
LQGDLSRSAADAADQSVRAASGLCERLTEIGNRETEWFALDLSVEFCDDSPALLDPGIDDKGWTLLVVSEQLARDPPGDYSSA